MAIIRNYIFFKLCDHVICKVIFLTEICYCMDKI